MYHWARKAIAVVMLKEGREPIAPAQQILWLKLNLILHNRKGIA